MDNCGYGEQLILLSAVLTFQIAKGRSVDELALLAALFTIIGDNLALLATTRADVGAVLENQNNSVTGASQK